MADARLQATEDGCHNLVSWEQESGLLIARASCLSPPSGLQTGKDNQASQENGRSSAHRLDGDEMVELDHLGCCDTDDLRPLQDGLPKGWPAPLAPRRSGWVMDGHVVPHSAKHASEWAPRQTELWADRDDGTKRIVIQMAAAATEADTRASTPIINNLEYLPSTQYYVEFCSQPRSTPCTETKCAGLPG